jgi:hypothetical protein
MLTYEHTKLEGVVRALTLASFFFPWINFNINKFDTQPSVFLFGMLYLLTVTKFRVPVPVLCILFLNMMGIFFVSVLYPSEVLSFNWIRSFISYATFPIVFCCVYDVCKKAGIPWHYILPFNYIWIIFGILDVFFPSFVDLVIASRTSADRGVASLAAEPSFFGLTLVMFNIVYLFCSLNIKACGHEGPLQRNLTFMIVMNCLAIIVLAQSLSSILVLVGFAAWWVFTRLEARVNHQILVSLALFVLGACSLVLLTSGLLVGDRLLNTLSKLFSNGVWETILTDGSANQRFDGMFASNFLAFKSWLVPGGFNSYLAERGNYVFLFDIIWYPTQNDIILSWIGAANYELGFFGLMSSVLCIYIISLAAKQKILFLFFIILFLLSPLPHASPFIGLLGAISFFLSRGIKSDA